MPIFINQISNVWRNTVKQNAYICIPKNLFTDTKYNKISSEAKLLYGLMLDRIKLSKSHGWQDKDGKAFVYFTIDEVKETFSCSNEKTENGEPDRIETDNDSE